MKVVLALFVTASSFACGGASSTDGGPTTPTATSSTPARATTLESFEGIEEPEVLYHPSSGGWTSDAFANGTFWHVFQLKATDGDSDPPLVVLSIQSGNAAAVRYWTGTASTFLVARSLVYSVGEWTTVQVRIRTSTTSNGYVLASVNGDPFVGVTGVAVYRPGSTDYRPKWGSYRAVDTSQPYGDDTVEQKDITAQRIAN